MEQLQGIQEELVFHYEGNCIQKIIFVKILEKIN